MRPSFKDTLVVLRSQAATPDDFDLLATVEFVSVEHVSAAEEQSRSGSWGRCVECLKPWPCPPWVACHEACVEWLIQRSSLAVRGIREHLKNEDSKDRREPA